MRPTDRRGFLRLLGLGALTAAAVPAALPSAAPAEAGDGPREGVLTTSSEGPSASGSWWPEVVKVAACVPVSREVLEDAPDLRGWVYRELERQVDADAAFRIVHG